MGRFGYVSDRENVSLRGVNTYMIYLNTAMEGILSEKVIQSIFSSLEFERVTGSSTPRVLERRFRNLTTVRDLMSVIVKASNDEIVITSNTTEGVNIVLNGLSLQAGDEILITTHEHFSCVVPFVNLARYRGVRINEIDIAPYFKEDGLDKEGLLKQISHYITPRLKVGFFSHVLYSIGTELPIREICQLLSKNDVFTIVDGAQAVGHIPVDVKNLECDAYTWTCSKWLHGPTGFGGLYISEDKSSSITPMFSGWRSVIDSVTLNYKPNASRFEASTLNFTMLPGLILALEAYLEEGAQQRFEQIKHHCDQLVQTVSSHDSIRILSVPPFTGIITLTSVKKNFAKLQDELFKADVVCKTIEHVGGVRFSPSHLLSEESTEKFTDIFASCI